MQFKEVLQEGEIQFVPEYSGIDPQLKGLKVVRLLSKKQTNPVDVVESSTDIVKHLQSFIDF